MSKGGAAAATVVLVHGAWHGAWCWDKVVDRLGAVGVRAVALDLPGHGADPGPLGDLHGDAARVRELLDGTAPPVVLLGHSYGGAVVTEAGDHPAVAHVVYLCALALDGHETCATTAVEEAAAAGISYTGRPDLGSGLVPAGQGAVTLDPAVATACLYNRCDLATAEWAAAQLGPQPMASLQQSPSAVAWRAKPSTYVVCTDDLAIHPGLQRILAARCTQSVEWDSDHSPFLSQPDRVAELLHELGAAAIVN